jgi:hypothetical protein
MRMANCDSCFEGEARDQTLAHMACITKYSDAAIVVVVVVVVVGGLENGEWRMDPDIRPSSMARL